MGASWGGGAVGVNGLEVMGDGRATLSASEIITGHELLFLLQHNRVFPYDKGSPVQAII